MARAPLPYRCRDEEPLRTVCDFGAVYRLYLRAPKRGRSEDPRLILKVTWEDMGGAGEKELQSGTFEIDLPRNRVIALGRKGNGFSAKNLPADWFCRWAREALNGGPDPALSIARDEKAV